MSYCQQFKKEIVDISRISSSLKELLEAYQKTGNKDLVGQIKQGLNKIELFESNYSDRVKDLLRQWYSGCRFKFANDAKALSDKVNGLLQRVSFRADGRVVVDGVFDLGYSEANYFPKLIAEIQGDLALYGNKIKTATCLEKVTGTIEADDILEYLPALTEVGVLSIPNSRNLKSCPRLEKINSVCRLPEYMKNIKEFKSVFPRLNYIGAIGGRSVILDSNQSNLKKELELLRDKGEILIEGDVIYRN